MKTQKTWLTIHFTEGKATLELTINYLTKQFSMSHGSNDNNVTFNGHMRDFDVHTDRVKCVSAALKYVQQELS